MTRAFDDDECLHAHEIHDINTTLDQVIEVDTLGALRSYPEGPCRLVLLAHDSFVTFRPKAHKRACTYVS